MPRFERFNTKIWYGKGAGNFFVKQLSRLIWVQSDEWTHSSVRVATDSRYAAINAESLLNKLFQAFLLSVFKQHPNLSQLGVSLILQRIMTAFKVISWRSKPELAAGFGPRNIWILSLKTYASSVQLVCLRSAIKHIQRDAIYHKSSD